MLFSAEPVSIIIPTYNRKSYLLKTLQALAHNQYPLQNVEVIVADDGSSDRTAQILQQQPFPFILKHVFQEDLGYRLAKIRNEGVKVSSHDFLIFLDCDMVPGKQFIVHHLKLLKKNPQNVSLGHRKFVSFSSVTKAILQHPERLEKLPVIPHRKTGSSEDWRLEWYRTTNFLKKYDEPYWACSGGNLGIHKAFFIQAGMYDEEFTGWGREDNELGFRLHQQGACFVPNLKAVAYHLDHEVDEPKIQREMEKNHLLFQKKTAKAQAMPKDRNGYNQVHLPLNRPQYQGKKKGVYYYRV